MDDTKDFEIENLYNAIVEIENKLKIEIRFLDDEIKRKVANVLENRNDFEEFMLVLPRNLKDLLDDTDTYKREFTEEQVREIQNAEKGRRLNGEILLDKWGTSGVNKPRLIHLIKALDKVGIHRASIIIRQHVGIDYEINDTDVFLTNSESYHPFKFIYDLEQKVLVDLQVDNLIIF